jgi:hypothetical protein
MKKLLALAVFVSTCSSIAHHRIGKEVLLGAQVYDKEIKLQVRSGGCTWKDSFNIEKYFNTTDNSVELTFIRKIPDNCEAYLPEGEVLTFSLGELRVRSGQMFKIKNAFAN